MRYASFLQSARYLDKAKVDLAALRVATLAGLSFSIILFKNRVTPIGILPK
jgi:hypothetical protein